MGFKKIIAGFGCCICFFMATVDVMAEANETDNTISVTVTGFRNDSGILVVSVVDAADGFPWNADHIVKTIKVKIVKIATKCEIKGLKPGTYALTVHHDEDGDGKLKKNLVQIPKEGMGASNNAKMSFGPPKWKDAKFEVGQKPLDQKIKLKYFL